MSMKRMTISVLGGFCLAVGILFVLIPGPAVIFIPLGLALLSLEYAWAKVWLKKSQRFFKRTAEQTDNLIRKWRYR